MEISSSYCNAAASNTHTSSSQHNFTVSSTEFSSSHHYSAVKICISETSDQQSESVDPSELVTIFSGTDENFDSGSRLSNPGHNAGTSGMSNLSGNPHPGGVSSDGGNGNPDGGSGNPDEGNGNPDGGSGNPDGGSGNPDGGSGNPDGGSGNPHGMGYPDPGDGEIGHPGKIPDARGTTDRGSSTLNPEGRSVSLDTPDPGGGMHNSMDSRLGDYPEGTPDPGGSSLPEKTPDPGGGALNLRDRHDPPHISHPEGIDGLDGLHPEKDSGLFPDEALGSGCVLNNLESVPHKKVPGRDITARGKLRDHVPPETTHVHTQATTIAQNGVVIAPSYHAAPHHHTSTDHGVSVPDQFNPKRDISKSTTGKEHKSLIYNHLPVLPTPLPHIGRNTSALSQSVAVIDENNSYSSTPPSEASSFDLDKWHNSASGSGVPVKTDVKHCSVTYAGANGKAAIVSNRSAVQVPPQVSQERLSPTSPPHGAHAPGATLPSTGVSHQSQSEPTEHAQINLPPCNYTTVYISSTTCTCDFLYCNEASSDYSSPSKFTSPHEAHAAPIISSVGLVHNTSLPTIATSKKSQLVPNTTVQPSKLPEPLDTCESRPPGNLSSIVGRRNRHDGLVKVYTESKDMHSEDNLRPAPKQ